MSHLASQPMQAIVLVAHVLMTSWSLPLGAPRTQQHIMSVITQVLVIVPDDLYELNLIQAPFTTETVPIIHLPLDDERGKASVEEYLNMFPKVCSHYFIINLLSIEFNKNTSKIYIICHLQFWIYFILFSTVFSGAHPFQAESFTY